MDEKEASGSCVVISEEKNESLYPMYFGVSCAFLALRLLSEPQISDEKWSEIRSGMLLGSVHLLGLLVWRVQKEEVDIDKSELLQKLENAQRDIEELKKIRSEDAKANEKVVGIFASQEQGWFNERRKLRQQIGALMNEVRVLETKKDKAISELNEKLHDNELLLKSKDKLIEDEEQKRHDLVEKLNRAHNTVEDLKESAKHEAQLHSSEISKHKTAFFELVSNRRQLESEMGRALRQVESAKQEFNSVLEQKEHSVLMAQKLSLELVKLQKDFEQKDQILSAMLRKSKLDAAEKQMLLEEMKLSKAKRKQAELKTERLKSGPEPRHERLSLRSMLSKHAKSKAATFSSGKEVHSNSMLVERPGSNEINHILDYEQPEFSPVPDEYSSQGNQDPTNFKLLEGWVRAQTEKYRIAIEERHNLEIDAFAEQLRLKDEKLEAFRWQLLSMELESKKLQSHVEALDHDLTQLRQDKLKLEALSLNREAELHSLREKLALQVYHPGSQNISANPYPLDLTVAPDTIWSKVKIIKEKKKTGEKEQETKTTTEGSYKKLENEKQDKILCKNQHKDIVLTLQSSEKEIEEEEHDALNPDSVPEESVTSQDVEKSETSSAVVKYMTKKNDSTWKMDLHALGVSYKIKWLKQQLFMLEKLAGKLESHVKSESDNTGDLGIKSFYALMPSLNKQVGRYQSLQGKTDDLCRRMHENDPDLKGGKSKTGKSKEETQFLEHFLEETFQLQRYIVATGQKLMELRTKIASGFVGVANELDTPASFDMKRFADSIITLFVEVQRGLEVRISRIIGDLEGTLARDGIIHFRSTYK